MPIAKRTIVSALMLLALAPCLDASEIYRWVDESGVVHFSDKPPASASPDVSTVAVDTSSPSAYDAESDVFNIEQTAARTQAHRKRLEDRRTARPPEPVQSVAQSGNQVVTYGNPYGYPLNARPPRPEPPLRPRPPIEPPIEPPPDDTSTLRPPGRSRQ